jgi:catechol 2,3-dioxygenase
MSAPREIGHLVLNVSDVDRSVAFYCDLIGFQAVRHEPGRSAFLTCGVIHHNLALFRASPDAAPPQKGQIGLNHFAFQVENYEALQRAYDRLVEAGVTINSTTDHGITRSVYFQDPDGIVMELFADAFPDRAEGMRYIRSSRAHADPLDITGPEPARPAILEPTSATR